MDAQQYLSILKAQNASQSSSPSIASPQVQVPTQKEEDTSPAFNKDEAAANKGSAKNPYSQQELHDFVKSAGFKVDGIAKFSELMKKIAPHIEEDTNQKDLTSLDNHDIIKDVSPSKKNDESSLSREALKKLIAKLRG